MTFTIYCSVSYFDQAAHMYEVNTFIEYMTAYLLAFDLPMFILDELAGCVFGALVAWLLDLPNAAVKRRPSRRRVARHRQAPRRDPRRRRNR